MQFDFSQPLYTEGRLRNTFGLQAAASDAARLTLDRARQQLTLRVVEAFYRALLQERGWSSPRRASGWPSSSSPSRIELSDARQALLETEWNLAQAKFAQILAAAKTRYAAGLS